MKSFRFALALTAALALSHALAQLPPQAQAAYDEAVRLEARAVAVYPKGRANIGQSVWAEAAAAAERAVTAAPGAPAPLLLRAQIYTTVGFWARAEAAWTAYLSVAGDADPGVRASYGEVLYNLGYLAYLRGDTGAALGRFQMAAQYAPADPRPVVWQARVLFERGEVRAALPLWERAASLAPNDARTRYFLDLTRRSAEYGASALSAFSRGYDAYEARRPQEALELFRAAVAAAPGWPDAQRWLGRVALESGLGEEALAAYGRVVELEGATPQNAYFLEYAREVARFGLEPVRAYRAGYDLYTKGDKAGAAARFEAAVAAQPQYQKAWAWLGRVRYETGDYKGAVAAYTEAVRLDPNDAASAYFLRLAGSR